VYNCRISIGLFSDGQRKNLQQDRNVAFHQIPNQRNEKLFGFSEEEGYGDERVYGVRHWRRSVQI